MHETETGLSPQDEQLIKDIAKHVIDQCEAAINRSKNITPIYVHHQISMNVVAGITAIAMVDTLMAFHRAFPKSSPPPFDSTLDAVFDRIKEIAKTSSARKVAQDTGMAS